ncbi:hypothetical protein NL449_28590, partial [Klebsiella pneumoniae]|nr:hypothetical protein [Klebsiella pneumoniae]
MKKFQESLVLLKKRETVLEKSLEPQGVSGVENSSGKVPEKNLESRRDSQAESNFEERSEK